MALDLVDYEQKAHVAVKAFWGNREAAKQKQIESGKADQGDRAGVTAGKNLGTAHDFWTAYREGGFGKQPRPFVGWLMMVEDAPKSRCAVRDASPHFPIFQEFKGASYLLRYDLLCQKLVKEQLYTTAAIITSPRSASETGEFSELSSMTGLRTFVTSLAGHVASASARLQ